MTFPFQRIIHCLIALFLTIPLHGQEDAEMAKLQAELEKARELFPKFQEQLTEDPSQAEKTFTPFLEMQDPMKKRLQTWLDAKWAEDRRVYEMMTRSGDVGGSEKLSADQRKKISDNRKLLEEIRGIGDEEEMKKRLKSEGWQALETLMTLTSKVEPPKEASPASSKKEEKALKDLVAVGQFRYRIRVSRGFVSMSPYNELGIPDPDAPEEEKAELAIPAAELIRADSAARKVFAKNEAMKSEIPRAEYDGILEVNQWRVALGLNALEIDPKLCDASRDHSKDMKTHDFFAHESPVEGKKQPWDRARNFGTQARAENIAINNSPEGANRAWFHSPGHHKNMFASGHSVIGLGIEGRHYTQMFR